MYAVLDFLLLILMSWSVPQAVHYAAQVGEWYKSSLSSSPSLTGSVLLVLILITLVFSVFILRPIFVAVVWRAVVFACICSWLCDSSAKSSATSRSWRKSCLFHWMPFRSPFDVSFITHYQEVTGKGTKDTLVELPSAHWNFLTCRLHEVYCMACPGRFSW